MHVLMRSAATKAGLIPVILLSIVLGASLYANFSTEHTAYAVDQTTVNQQNRATLSQLQDAFTSIVNQVSPTVVSIASKQPVSERESGQRPDDDFFRQFPFPFPGPEGPGGPGMSAGSGVIVRNDGYVLTNDHVVGGAETVTVTLNDGREFKGKVFRDPRSDLALIKIDAKNLSAAKLGDSDRVKVGSWAIAVGSPFGLEQTVTVGVVSGLGRKEVVQDKFYPNLIQTDASINPGNSGGPLVNIDGEIIGINTLIRSGMGGGNIGIGFAIPANTAKFVLNQLITHGKVTRGFLGVSPADMSPKDAEIYGVKEGAFVQSVEEGSPADKAGIEVEDVIVEIDGKRIANEVGLRETLSATPPGTQIDVTLVRNKQRKSVHATVGQFKEESVASAPKETTSKLGFTVANITDQIRERFKLDDSDQGVVVTSVASGGPAMREGLQPGMVILRVGDEPVTTVAKFEAEMAKYKSGDTARLRVKTAERTIIVRIPLD